MFRKTRNYLTEIDPALLKEALQKSPFVPCGALDRTSSGWIPPVPDNEELLVEIAPGYFVFQLKTQKKILPKAEVTERTKEKVKDIEANENRVVGRKERKEISTVITDELLPNAFSQYKTILVAYAAAKGLLMIETSTSSAAEELVSVIRNHYPPLSAKRIFTESYLSKVFADWVLADTNVEALPFALMDSCHLLVKTTGETIRFKNSDISGSAHLPQLLADGKEIVKMALMHEERVTFTLDSDFVLTNISLAATAKEEAEENAEGAAELCKASMLLMITAIETALWAAIEAAGGIKKEESAPQASGTEEQPAPTPWS